MMLVSVISLLFSFLLQGLYSNFFFFLPNNLSFFSATFLLINFVVLYSYFENDRKFLTLIIIFGLLFDITYSNTLLLNTCIFAFIFYINKLFNFFFPSNIFTVNIFSFISMIIYNVISFFILKLLQFDSYNYIIIIKVILSNILITILYTSIVYYIINYIYKKLNLKKIRV